VTTAVDAAVVRVFRDEWGRIVATLIRVTGDWDLAEESAQEAFTRALGRWRRDGIPSNPGAWLMTVARNLAVDIMRRAKVGEAKQGEATVFTFADEAGDDSGIGDDRLQLIFTCCHPALRLEAQVALTLRTLAGLTTREIARAFLVSEQTMAKRVVRAKAKIRNAHIPYRVPPAHLLPERTVAVLGVVYLLFNEGYAATAGVDLVRESLCDEAIRLGRALAELMPDEPEVLGLLALMLLHHARREARVDDAGVLVPLEEQDRTRWDRDVIGDAIGLLDAAGRRGEPGPYQMQAAIAACHATAAEATLTDWGEIVRLYGRLCEVVPNPVVALNGAVAVAMAVGPAAGLVLLDQLEAQGTLEGYRLLPATRADMLRRLDRLDEAAVAYQRAIELAATDAERRYLARRLTETARHAEIAGDLG